MSVPYLKPATSITEQIQLLQSRGLKISDTGLASHFLLHVGYYRLAGYWQIFQEDRTKHIFFSDATLEKIIDLYNFDRELRLLIIDAVERIEVSFRSVLADIMCCKYSVNWYAEERFAYNNDTHFEIMDIINRELDRTSEEFIEHHDEKYGIENYPPAWKTFQVLSFGTLSRLYGNMRNDIPERKIIAQKYGLPGAGWLHSWMQVVSVLRNYCAHHSRVCYRLYSFPPKDMSRTSLPWLKNIPTGTEMANQLLYYQLCAIRYLMHSCSPGNTFNEKLKLLIEKYPVVDMKRMGFLEGWEHEALWK